MVCNIGGHGYRVRTEYVLLRIDLYFVKIVLAVDKIIVVLEIRIPRGDKRYKLSKKKEEKKSVHV